jgi:hypothetical protein
MFPLTDSNCLRKSNILARMEKKFLGCCIGRSAKVRDQTERKENPPSSGSMEGLIGSPK